MVACNNSILTLHRARTGTRSMGVEMFTFNCDKEQNREQDQSLMGCQPIVPQVRYSRAFYNWIFPFPVLLPALQCECFCVISLLFPAHFPLMSPCSVP